MFMGHSHCNYEISHLITPNKFSKNYTPSCAVFQRMSILIQIVQMQSDVTQKAFLYSVG